KLGTWFMLLPTAAVSTAGACAAAGQASAAAATATAPTTPAILSMAALLLTGSGPRGAPTPPPTAAGARRRPAEPGTAPDDAVRSSGGELERVVRLRVQVHARDARRLHVAAHQVQAVA